MTAEPDHYKQSPMYLFLDIQREDIKAVSRKPRMEIING
jgi:hypothetical protein